MLRTLRCSWRQVTELTGSTRTWLATELPVIHQAGATSISAALGTNFNWTQEHRAAVQAMADRSWTDIAARLQDIDGDTRRVLRREIADATRATLLESRTAVQAGRTVAAAARDAGLFTVTYRNGAQHTIADWADSTIRQVTAETFNRGSVEQCRTDGIEHVQYVDGPGCSVGPRHRNGPEANGIIVALDDLVWTSHPRCRRALLPAPHAAALPGLDRDPGPEPEAAPKPTARDPLATKRATPRTARSGRSGRGTPTDPVDEAVDDLMARSAQAAPAIRADVIAAADGLGEMVGLEYMLKTDRQRLIDKARQAVADGIAPDALRTEIRDAVRFTVQIDTASYAAGHDTCIDRLTASLRLPPAQAQELLGEPKRIPGNQQHIHRARWPGFRGSVPHSGQLRCQTGNPSTLRTSTS